MPQGIDSFISLHFADRVEAFGPDDEVIVTLQPGAGPDALQSLPGVQVAEQREATLAAKVQPGAREALLENSAVRQVSPTRRPSQIAVLIHLRNPAWNRDIPGLEKGSRMGRILSAVANENAVKALSADPDVISVEASRATGVEECAVSMPYVGAAAAHQPPLSEQGEEAVVAIIDAGIDVLHHAFQDAGGKTRLLAIWDQRSSSGPTPKDAAAAGQTNGADYTQNFGRYHSQSDIDGYIAAATVPADLGRDFRMVNGSPIYGHGTHVASIVAGSPFTAAGGGAFPGGVAPRAGIIVVIPKMAVSPGDPASVGYSSSHVEALAFIRITADALNKPVAVNVSLGMNAGAHDGTSLLEIAFDEFSGGGRDPGYVVVKSAGNEQGFDGHAQAQPVTGSTVTIEWETTFSFRSQDYLEFWFPSSDDLEFTLTPPAGPPIRATRTHRSAQGNLPNGQGTYYMALERFHHDNGDGRLVVLARNNNGAYSQDGRWKLEIRGRNVVSGSPVHGWIERDNSRAARFVSGQVVDGTLSIPGTARTVVCVGACESHDPVQVPNFSSQGPCRDERRKPELVAPGVGIIAAASGSADGATAMDGTSMAAPHVTGAVALLLSRRRRNKLDQVNAAQVRAALSQCVAGYAGAWNAGAGYGRLDVGALLSAFD